MSLAQKYIEIVRNRGARQLKLGKVYRNIRNRDLFLAAYGKLYANTGATTPGIDPTDTVDGMSLERIDKIINQLKAGTYQWKPVKRVYRPKKGKQGKRPLGMPGWQDKMVQEVSRRVLEAYYEPQFSDKSHGFRPGRGCHTALAQICDTWIGTKWFIEGDIKGCYDNLDQEILLDIIGRDIQDKRFLKLLKEMLKAGYIEDWTYHETYSGAPQGGIVSPILANIYLNELDKFVENELIPQYTTGHTRKRNPEYRRLLRQMAKAKEVRDIETYRRLQKRLREISSVNPADSNYRRLRYCRYAGDFLLGFIGPRSEAIEIKEKIRAFLQTIKLSLSEEKTLITSATKGMARFLGYDLYVTIANSRITTYTVSGTTTKVKRRATNGHVILSVPQDVAQAWKNRYTQKGKPIHRKELTNNSDYEIVMTYNAEFQGVVNYYGMAHNVATRLYPVKYHYLQSLGKTLAHKHKKPMTWVYRNYYEKSEYGIKAIVVTIPRKEPKKPLVAKFGAKPIRHVKRIVIKDEKPKPIHTGRNEIVQRLLAEKCELCGAEGKTEGHHIRKIADIRKKYKGRKHPPRWTAFMMERNRKAIMVCNNCHQAIHSGKYDGPKLA